MRNTRGAQQGVHPTSLCAALIPSPACLLSRAGLRQSSTPFPLSVLLCCTACKAQPVLHTGHVPAAPTDKGSNPGSIEVQWCQKTQETALNSQILSTERFPAALHPLGPHTRPCNSLLSTTFPRRQQLEATLLPCLSPASGDNHLGATSSATPHPTGPCGCQGCRTLDVCLHQPLYLLHPEKVQTSMRVTGFAFQPYPLAGVKQKQVFFLHHKSDIQYLFLIIAFFCTALTNLPIGGLGGAVRAQKGKWKVPLQCCSTHPRFSSSCARHKFLSTMMKRNYFNFSSGLGFFWVTRLTNCLAWRGKG